MKKTALFFSIGLLLAAAVVLVGCSGQERPRAETEKTHGQTEHMSTEKTEPGQVEAEAQAVDPVCGMKVSTNSPHKAEHKGKTYYFCNASCKERFMAEPGKYLSGT